MENIVLSPIPLNQLLEQMRAIVREELKAEQAAHDRQDERLLTSEEARKLFQPELSARSMKYYIQKGLIPMVKMGSRNYFKKSEVLNAAKGFEPYKQNR